MTGDGRLPDLDDMEALQEVVIPEVERMVSECEPFTQEWATWMTLLGVIRNRLLFIHRIEEVEARVGDLEQHTRDLTDDGVARVVAKVIAGIRLGVPPE